MFLSDGRSGLALSGQGALQGGLHPLRQRGEHHDNPTDTSMIRVVHADDSFLAREGLTHVLGSIDDVELVASCADLDELRSTVDEVRPDVVLTDIRMPPTNTDEGIRYAGEIGRASCRERVLTDV